MELNTDLDTLNSLQIRVRADNLLKDAVRLGDELRALREEYQHTLLARELAVLALASRKPETIEEIHCEDELLGVILI